MNAQALTITYSSSVFTAAGWRNVEITAQADRVSPGMAVVTKVVAIDGEEPRYGMSRTGAKRQQFNGISIAKREEGAKKRISSCRVTAE